MNERSWIDNKYSEKSRKENIFYDIFYPLIVFLIMASVTTLTGLLQHPNLYGRIMGIFVVIIGPLLLIIIIINTRLAIATKVSFSANGIHLIDRRKKETFVPFECITKINQIDKIPEKSFNYYDENGIKSYKVLNSSNTEILKEKLEDFKSKGGTIVLPKPKLNKIKVTLGAIFGTLGIIIGIAFIINGWTLLQTEIPEHILYSVGGAALVAFGIVGLAFSLLAIILRKKNKTLADYFV